MDLDKLMKQAMQMKGEYDAKKAGSKADRLSARYIGEYGEGIVTIEVDGECNVHDVKIKDCEETEDVAFLQDFIKIAFNNAKKKRDDDPANAEEDITDSMMNSDAMKKLKF